MFLTGQVSRSLPELTFKSSITECRWSGFCYTATLLCTRHGHWLYWVLRMVQEKCRIV